MKFFILIFIVLQSYLSACSMCAANVPKVIVNTNIIYKNDKTIFEVTWDFHKEFVNSLTLYDQNENNRFEENEKLLIKDSLISYLQETHYLVDIEYIHKDKKFELNYYENIKASKSELEFTQDGMRYKFDFELPFVLQNDFKLYISYDDAGGNFDFSMKDIVLKNYSNYKEIEPKLMYTYIHFYETAKHTMPKVYEDDRDKKPLIVTISKQKNIEEKSNFTQILSENLTQIKNDLELTLKDIKENNSIISYFWLLLFSFAYGVIHAIGPGHGKTLVSSYFINQNKSYIKAFSISAMIGIVHTFSAFLLTLVIYYSLGVIFNSTLTDIEQIATKVSAVIIILIALYLIYKKIPKNKSNIVFKEAQQQSYITIQKHSHKDSLSCGCGACKTTSTDLGVILAAGIIPCPGTVTIFIFTMSLGIYFVGFLSALFMSVGMILVIFITAIISVKIRKKSSSNKLLVKVLEYGSLVFILSLGIILFFIA